MLTLDYVSCSAVPRSLVKINLGKEIPFPTKEASFVHPEAQMKCYMKHEYIKCICVIERLRVLQ